MHKPPNFRVLMMNVILFSAFASIFYFTWKKYPNIFTMIQQQDFSFMPYLFIMLGVHAVVITTISIMFFRKQQSKLADSNLIFAKGVDKEQAFAKTEAFIANSGKPWSSWAYKTALESQIAIPLAQNIKLTQEKSREHVAIYGPTGSGKSSAFFIPILLHAAEFYKGNLDPKSPLHKEKSNFLVTDPKGEICRKTRDALSKNYNVIHFDFTNPVNSATYSLLENCKTPDDVRKLADSILGAEGHDTWTKLSTNLLLAFLFIEFDKPSGPKNMNNVMKLFNETEIDDYEDFFENCDSANALIAWRDLKKTMSGDGYLSSIFATLQSKLLVFGYENVQQITASNSFTVDDLRLRSTVLFVSYPEDDSSTYAPFLASFYYQIFNKAKAHPSVDEGKSDGSGRQITFLLDEFCNVGRIPEFSTLLTTIRSKKMGIVLGIQSTDQIEKVYGPLDARIIQENSKTRVLLSGISGNSAANLQALIGEEEFKQTSNSFAPTNHLTNTSESMGKKHLLSADQIRRLKSFEVIIVSDNLKPIKDYKNYYYMNKIQFFIFKNLPFKQKTNMKIGKALSKLFTIQKRQKKKQKLQAKAEDRKQIKLKENQAKRRDISAEKKPQVLMEDPVLRIQRAETNQQRPRVSEKAERTKRYIQEFEDDF
ncbi:hypothetical protein COL23_25595 [Priestia aryabhattai]|uniref:type IV secretory system conjugative DNA transfer family protein n=1 Tax=Priestia aryabhattai TaxID=412384 RepID=UPI000BF48EC1|nr:type IV secretory system conjugative DNA transfer family protein [Priestia aryabhattai]PFW72127.1 hypothetical protein COL23_25595 [Priestia aryabhattai]